MAKSLFEPKKVPTYTENIIKPGAGLQAAPVPTRQRTVSTGTPKLAQAQSPAPAPIPAAPPQPTPQPAPPAIPAETRAFSFDGATELTGSFKTSGGNKMLFFTMHGTFTPGWSQETTGSFTFFTVRNPSDDNDVAWTYGFQRVSGSNGYEDRITSRISSGSATYSSYKKLLCSPNFYSGSTRNLFLEVASGAGNLQVVRENGKFNTQAINGGFSGVGNTGRAASAVLSPLTHVISIGGHASGSSEYYSGSISNFSVAKGTQTFLGSSMPSAPEKNRGIDFVFKFEGNLANPKGTQTLGVVGTETYVSSSI